MDQFTQRLLERTRQRREVLQKKLENSPAPVQRKRKPLGEDQTDNIIDDNQQNDDSPKRQCLREQEREIKPDTPAIQGVRSRMQHLAAQHRAWNGDEGRQRTEYISPTKAPEPEITLSTVEKTVTPNTRKGRLAALAQNINNWEDDLHHSTPPLKKPDPSADRSKKGAAPPPPVLPETAKSPAKGLAPLPPCSPAAKSPLEIKNRVEEEDSGPMKPPRTYEYEQEHRDGEEATTTAASGNVVSKLTVTLGSSNKQTQSNSITVIPKTCKSNSTSPIKQAVSTHHVQTTSITTTEKKTSSAVSTSVPRSPVKSVARTFDSPVKNEPTQQPVSAQLHAWQTKVSEVESQQVKAPRSPTKITNAKAAIWQPKNSPTKPAAGKSAMTEKETSPVKHASSPVHPVSCSAKPRQAPSEPVKLPMPQLERVKKDEKKDTRKSFEPTSQSVLMRMAAWQSRTSQNCEETQASGIKGAKPSVYEPTSPSKLTPAAKGLQEKVSTLQRAFNQNDKLQQAKQQRQEELQQLNQRWKDGILREDADANQQQHNDKLQQSEPPPPPPPPPAPTTPAPPKTAPPCDIVRKASMSAPPKNSASLGVHSKKEDARDRARADFESKLKLMGFDLESTADLGHVASIDLNGHPKPERPIPKTPKTSTPVPEASKWEIRKDVVVNWNEGKTTKTDVRVTTNSSSVKKEVPAPAGTPRNGGSSIYSLIKKQQTAGGTSAPTSAVVTKANPAPVAPVHNTVAALRQTSSVDDSFGESTMESYTDDPTSVSTLPEDSTSGSDQHQGGRDSLSSNNSGYSESNCSETQTEDYTETETGADYTEDDTAADETADYSGDDDGYSDEDYSDEEDVIQGIDTLLDEALDDSTEDDRGAVPAPRRQASHHRKASPAKETFKQPTVAAVERHPSGGHYTPYNQPTSSCGSTSSSTSETENEKETIYSVEFYRASKGNKKHPTPKMTIVRHADNTQVPMEREDKLPYIPEREIKEKLRELQELINQEQSVIMQTSNALNQCCGQNSTFAGSMEQVECNKLLLIACKRREAYIAEMERLKGPEGARQRGGARGSLTISDIRLPLKGDFTSKLGTSHDTTVHYFIVLVRNGPQLVFTQMVSTHDPNLRGSIEFPNLIKISDIRQDFRLSVEVYGMSITREPMNVKKQKSKGTLTPRKLLKMKSSSHTPLQSPGGPFAVRTTNFVLIGGMPLNMNCVNKMHFSLDKVPFLSPLQGSIHLRLRCLIETQVQEHGFLTMFEDVSGFGAWHRRWCVLRNNTFCYWKYPDDEKIKEPMGVIDLKCCITDTVGLIPRDICARPNTFELVTVRRQNKGENDTLTSRCYNTMTTTRHMLSADTKDERIIWCNSLNQALVNVRSWNADALRPVKQSRSK